MRLLTESLNVLKRKKKIVKNCELMSCKNIFSASDIVSERFRHIPWFFDFIFKRSSIYRKEIIERDKSYNILKEIVERKAEKRKIDQEFDTFAQNTFLNRLLLLKDKMTEQQMKEHVYSVGSAGYETTGNAVAHCMLFLAQHDEVQKKAYEEILKVFPSDDTPITHQSLLELEFMERVMKESLRISPTVHAMVREAMNDFEVTPGQIIQKGTFVCINIYGLHHRKDLWGDDVESFNPDRFLPEHFHGKQQCFIPFSGEFLVIKILNILILQFPLISIIQVGRRNCIGYRYAFTSFKIMLVKLLRNFKFSSTLKFNELQFDRKIALKLIGPHLVKIERRQKL